MLLSREAAIFSINICVFLIVLFFGPVHDMVTYTSISTIGLNSILHVKVTLDPRGRIGLSLLLATNTDVGAGTAWRRES